MGFVHLHVLYLTLICLCKSEASVFMGGSIVWSPVDNEAAAVDFTDVYVTMLFYSAYNDTLQCQNDMDKSIGYLIGDSSGSLISQSGDPSWSLSTLVECYAYSVSEAWSAGKQTKLVTNVTTTQLVTAAYKSGSWPNGSLTTDGTTDFDFEMTMNLSTRADTNLINSSPYTNMPSFLHQVKMSCPDKPLATYTFQVSVQDKDGDTVRCRCQNDTCLSIVTVYAQECVVSVTPTSPGFLVVDLVLEDFALSADTYPLSSVPVKLLIQAVTSDLSQCGRF